MLVRPLDSDDLTPVAEIYRPYVEETYITFELDPPTVEQWAAKLEQARALGHPWFVAEVDGVVEGFFAAFEVKPRPAYRTSVEVSIYIRRGSERRGFGRELFETALPALADAGFHRALAGIALPNDASVALHERFGFKLCGVFTEVGHKLGAYRDVGWWELALSD